MYCVQCHPYDYVVATSGVYKTIKVNDIRHQQFFYFSLVHFFYLIVVNNTYSEYLVQVEWSIPPTTDLKYGGIGGNYYPASYNSYGTDEVRKLFGSIE